MFASRALRHWLLGVNAATGAFLGGAVAAPLLAAFGWQAAADGLYAAYHLTCHQWAFRTFFVFGQQPVYTEQALAELGSDPFGFVGDNDLGWKLAICERDLAIYVALLLVGLVYARRRQTRPLGFTAYAVLVLPMAIDGFTQLLGWRESTWQLRVVTGSIFGLASGWLVLPRLDAAFGRPPAAARYAPDAVCDRLSPASRRG
jgi:uncharacterized membrane protein